MAEVWGCSVLSLTAASSGQRSLILWSATPLFRYKIDDHGCPRAAGPCILGSSQEMQPRGEPPGSPESAGSGGGGLGRLAGASRISPKRRDLPKSRLTDGMSVLTALPHSFTGQNKHTGVT